MLLAESDPTRWFECKGSGVFVEAAFGGEAERYETKVYLAGSDGRDPETVR
ncbi:MAG: hypothetical protein ABI072_01125 [Edaphobacter sp.]